MSQEKMGIMTPKMTKPRQINKTNNLEYGNNNFYVENTFAYSEDNIKDEPLYDVNHFMALCCAKIL